MSEETPVRSERRGSACWITIDRPEKRNAINNDVVDGICEAWCAAEADADVRVIVLTGAGDKAFCAGGDLKPGAGFAFDVNEPSLGYADMLRMVAASSTPSIARVNGACVAGGMGLLCMTDLAVAAETATFGLPEVKIGLFPMQVLALLQRQVPARTVSEWCLLGETFDAAEARRAGLLNRVVAPGELDAEVEKMAEALAKRSPTALRHGKHALRAVADMNFEQALTFAESRIVLLSQTDDAREGLAAFAEKRPPRWSR